MRIGSQDAAAQPISLHSQHKSGCCTDPCELDALPRSPVRAGCLSIAHVFDGSLDPHFGAGRVQPWPPDLGQLGGHKQGGLVLDSDAGAGVLCCQGLAQHVDIGLQRGMRWHRVKQAQQQVAVYQRSGSKRHIVGVCIVRVNSSGSIARAGTERSIAAGDISFLLTSTCTAHRGSADLSSQRRAGQPCTGQGSGQGHRPEDRSACHQQQANN